MWSLAIQANLSALISTVAVWWLVPWRPTGKASLHSLRSMFGFGSRILTAGLLNTVFDRVQLLLIGKVFGPADLGYYTRAYSTQQMPASVFQSVVSKVTFPMFSTIAVDRERLKAAMRKCMMTIGAVVIPMMVGLALMATPACHRGLRAQVAAVCPLFEDSGLGGSAVAAACRESGRVDGGRAFGPVFPGGGRQKGGLRHCLGG